MSTTAHNYKKAMSFSLSNSNFLPVANYAKIAKIQCVNAVLFAILCTIDELRKWTRQNNLYYLEQNYFLYLYYILIFSQEIQLFSLLIYRQQKVSTHF